jgi:hypothetical protein
MRRCAVEEPVMRKQIRLIVMARGGNLVALVHLATKESKVRAKAVVEECQPALVYETEEHLDERSALADVATWLRSRCHASATCLATDGGAVVVITGDPSLRVRGDAERPLVP